MNRLLLHIALLLCALQVHGNDSIDAADRLTEVARGGQTVMSIGYAGNGNITAKTDIGSYTYASAKPHAVTGVSNTEGLIHERGQNIIH